MKKKQEISIGDKVRFVITSYYELAKSEYNLPHFFNNPADDLNLVMLGACYKIEKIEKNKWGTKVCKISFNNIVIPIQLPISYFVLYSKEQDCKFNINERVFFKPKSLEKDVTFLTGVFPQIGLKNQDGIFIIEKIINSYYVLVRSIEGDIIDFPLLWTDFKK